jgi:hypothetical protein
MIRCVTLAALALLTAAPAQGADSCDALTAKMIRATGASLAGRTGALAVFRAADAERMSLECAPRRQMIFGARQREPIRPYFVLIGLAAEGLTGASAEAVEVLALNLHQDSLLTGEPRAGAVGRAALRCETGPRADALAGNLTVCRLTPSRATILRRRAGLPAAAKAG